jgi:hypothetical protein
MPNLTKIAAWAETIGISRQSAYDAVKRCAIPVEDGKIDPDVANVLYAKHTRARANAKNAAFPAGAGEKNGAETPAAAPKKVAGYDTSRAVREEAEARISQMKLAEMEGKYLLKTEVADAVFEITRALRDGLTNCARRIAADVAAFSTADECEAVIEREHRALLESMNHGLASQLQLGGDAEDVDG